MYRDCQKGLCLAFVSLSPWPKVACRRQCRQSSPVRTFLAVAKLWLMSPHSTEYIPHPTRKDEDNSPHLSHRGMGSLRRSHYQGSGGNHRWELLSPSPTSLSHLCWVGSFFAIFASPFLWSQKWQRPLEICQQLSNQIFISIIFPWVSQGLSQE